MAIGSLSVALLAPTLVWADALTPESGGSPNADEIDALYKLVLYVALAVFVAVEGMLVYSLVRYRAGRGRVVLIGSRVADGIAGRSQYASTKAALRSLARSWAAEVVAQGVTVNVVSPAATETPMLADPARSTAAPKLPPMGRLIKPGEIASLVTYLLSPAAEAITGQDIRICGGASLGA